MDNDQLARMLKENTDAITKLAVESAEVKSGLKSLEAKADMKFSVAEDRIEDVKDRVGDVKNRVGQVKTDVASNRNFMLGVMAVGFYVLAFVVAFSTFILIAMKQ
ncbi:MAG: hypothetical protein OXF05_02580 [Hyphomicrobiales bacterium]|nr:hypothetical protein [Hyphomicrobiales bacterium]MCY4039343.1 hypothetical protein [Hyphomicrobiales bacterium]